MHIIDGVLSLPVLVTGGVLAVAGTFMGLRRMELEHIPQVGLLSAAFFLASLIHVPIGPSSVHMILNGLMGLVLGWAAFPALLAGLLLEAVFFGFGGVVVMGVNLTNTALPAVLVYLLFGKRLAAASKGKFLFLYGFILGCCAIILTTGMVALCLSLSGDEFIMAARLVFFAHLPVTLLEGFITGAAVVLIVKVKPELFLLPHQLAADDAIADTSVINPAYLRPGVHDVQSFVKREP